MNQKQGLSAYYLLFVVAVFLSGCAGTVKNMRAVPPEGVTATPEEGKSMVVFMRPSGLGFGVQSSVFEIKGEDPILAGIVAAKKKVAYQLEPGKHLFMVLGESADFMSAELEPDKIYYAHVTPRSGWLKARFSLKPVHSDELNSSQFNKWLESCKWVKLSDSSHDWARNNMPNIQSKYKRYYKKWNKKESSNRPKLLPKDGK
jgi:hypothetical protein